jgi:serine/threonine-protein kinase
LSSSQLPVSASDLAAFERRTDALLVVRLRQGLYVGIGVGLVLTPVTRLSFPDLPLRYVLLPFAASAVMILTSLATRFPGMDRAAVPLACAVSYAVSALGALASIETGGFQSPYFHIHFLICTFATAFLPLSPRGLVAACAPNLFVTCAVILALSPHPGQMVLPAVLSAAGLLYAYFGVVIRHAADLQSFVAHARLDETRGSLAELNDDLAQRVKEQVAEIVRRADDVEVLNAQLREKVRERSRELAKALRALEQDPASSVLPAGAVLGGRVVIERLLGAGGMGAVYLGEDRVTRRRVAVKVMASGILASPLAIRRFLAEADAAAAISHPGIVKTLHVDVSGEGTPFLVMEYVDGIPLNHVVRRTGKLTPAMVARVGEGVARALVAAHAAGVIHRDVKPGNVMIAREPPSVRVLDFGVSKLADGEEGAAGLTATGVVVGTPAYMAPEQVRGASSVTSACDVYSLGVLLFELASGQHPFPTREGLSLLFAHTVEKPRSLRDLDPSIPPELSSLVAAALAKDPIERPSAHALADALAVLAEGAPDAASLLSVFDSATLPTAALPATKTDTHDSVAAEPVSTVLGRARNRASSLRLDRDPLRIARRTVREAEGVQLQRRDEPDDLVVTLRELHEHGQREDGIFLGERAAMQAVDEAQRGGDLGQSPGGDADLVAQHGDPRRAGGQALAERGEPTHVLDEIGQGARRRAIAAEGAGDVLVRHGRRAAATQVLDEARDIDQRGRQRVGAPGDLGAQLGEIEHVFEGGGAGCAEAPREVGARPLAEIDERVQRRDLDAARHDVDGADRADHLTFDPHGHANVGHDPVRIDQHLRYARVRPRVGHDEWPLALDDDLAERVATIGRPRHGQRRRKALVRPEELHRVEHEAEQPDGHSGERDDLLADGIEHRVGRLVQKGLAKDCQAPGVVEIGHGSTPRTAAQRGPLGRTGDRQRATGNG